MEYFCVIPPRTWTTIQHFVVPGYIFLTTLLITSTSSSSDLPPWHMKPFGSHIRPLPVDETFTTPSDTITAQQFAQRYRVELQTLFLYYLS